jgi:hypothetical protein cdiviTM7_00195
MDQITLVAEQVQQLLNDPTDGHGFDHVERVRKIALQIAEQEGGDRQIIDLAVLLHDVDDYKIFGQASADNLTNAKRILSQAKIATSIRHSVLDIISHMGYSKYLKGIRPQTLEGQIVSDADMCDAIGTQGILRTHAFTLSQGHAFFNPAIAPRRHDLSPEQYQARAEHAVQHFFDKLLLIPNLMLTPTGQQIAQKRQQIMIDFLTSLFKETDSEIWQKHLQEFLDQY